MKTFERAKNILSLVRAPIILAERSCPDPSPSSASSNVVVQCSGCGAFYVTGTLLAQPETEGCEQECETRTSELCWKKEHMGFAPSDANGGVMLRGSWNEDYLPGGKSCRSWCSEDPNLVAYGLHPRNNRCYCYTSDTNISMYDGKIKESGALPPINAWDITEADFQGYSIIDGCARFGTLTCSGSGSLSMNRVNITGNTVIDDNCQMSWSHGHSDGEMHIAGANPHVNMTDVQLSKIHISAGDDSIVRLLRVTGDLELSSNATSGFAHVMATDCRYPNGAPTMQNLPSASVYVGKAGRVRASCDETCAKAGAFCDEDTLAGIDSVEELIQLLEGRA